MTKRKPGQMWYMVSDNDEEKEFPYVLLEMKSPFMWKVFFDGKVDVWETRSMEDDILMQDVDG